MTYTFLFEPDTLKPRLMTGPAPPLAAGLLAWAGALYPPKKEDCEALPPNESVLLPAALIFILRLLEAADMPGALPAPAYWLLPNEFTCLKSPFPKVGRKPKDFC